MCGIIQYHRAPQRIRSYHVHRCIRMLQCTQMYANRQKRHTLWKYTSMYIHEYTNVYTCARMIRGKEDKKKPVGGKVNDELGQEDDREGHVDPREHACQLRAVCRRVELQPMIMQFVIQNTYIVI